MELTQVGTYRRHLGASLGRLLENALDWEHLPWLHAASFNSLNVGEQHLWVERDHLVFEEMERPLGASQFVRVD